MCEKGLRKLPFNASAISDKMSLASDGDWNVAKTSYGRFGACVRAMEEKGLLKMSKSKDDLAVTWVKFEYKIVAKSANRPARERGDRRDRDRRDGGRRGGGGDRKSVV
jgi:hypothetical protein